jgi:hypothetical protein
MEWRLLGRAAALRSAMLTFSRNKILITAVLAATWTAALAFGARVLFKYETTPGASGPIVSIWPSTSTLPQPAGKPTLLMAAHPHCPCTRASIGELAEVMAHALGKVNAYVLFVKPEGAGNDWDDTDLRRSAAAIPGVTVVTDANGVEAARFGAQTSGHTLIFDHAGTLLFSGGITASRGHAGANAGENAVLAILNQQSADRQRTPVFGCSLANRKANTEEHPCSK